MADRHVVIVGGGVAGLSAARAALARGRELERPVAVTVLERSERFGGNVFTERVDGFVLDGGPDSWVVTKPAATSLARELGLGAALVGTLEGNRRYYVAWGDRLHPVPEGLVLGVPTRVGPLVRSRLFSWAGKVRMGLEPFVRARRFEADDDESIADFAARRLGREAAERLVAPLLGGISAGDASEISVRAGFPQLVAMEREHGSLVQGMRAARAQREASARVANGAASTPHGGGSAFVSLSGGVGELVRALVERLRADGAVLREKTTADSVTRAADGRWSVALAGGESLSADAVLLAVPGHVAARLAGTFDDGVARALATIRYGSTATAFLGYRRADVTHPLDGVGFLVPRAAGRPILASTWVSSKWADRAPEGHVLLRVFFGGTWGERVLAGSDDDLVGVARGELRALMGVDAEPVMTKVFRFDRASAQMQVGHLAAMRSIHARLASVAPGVLVAGGGYDGVGIPDCIRQGQDAGRTLAGG